MGINFGYARVSSKTQNLDRQLEALSKYVEDVDYIYEDKQSGADMDRKGYQEMKKAMRKGDTLFVKSIDRLGRNKHHIKAELEYFKEKGIRVKIIDLPTSMQDVPEGQEWVIEMINNIIIEVYSSMAEQERHTIKTRQAEGIAVAQKNGVKFGRPSLELPHNWENLYKRWKDGEIKAVDFMREVDMKKATFYKKVKEYELRD
ncbi:recombinase family protein [Peribacillus asahii]|uniref:recombinase family protein n=1 Tax=Peribacillus asahii TaxID=228899 RepID=UPI003808ADFB